MVFRPPELCPNLNLFRRKRAATDLLLDFDMQIASNLNSPKLEDLYQKYKFGNIKQQDRTLYFPSSKLKPFHLPWQPIRETKSWSSLLKKDSEVAQLQTSTTQPKKSKKEDWKNIPASSKEITIAPRGLINNGNMCFMNATLQPLLYTVPFYMFLLGLSKRKLLDQEKTPILDSMIKFVMEFNIYPDPTKGFSKYLFRCCLFDRICL
jgi:Ubiquitin carboxyl-terminal hydrolase